MSTISMLTSSPISVTDPTTTVSSNVNLDEASTSRYDQCDYNLLFSHLPASFAHLSQIQLSQLSLHVVGSGSGSLPPPPPITTDQHAVQKLCYALVALCFGLFYSLIGYRFLKLSAFIMGFALGSSIIYMILAEQKQLTVVENLIISLSIGCLFAFVALLVQYIGLFLLGITASISIVTCILIVIDLFHTNQSAWLCILLMFSCATLVASITLKFQKSLTIFNTSAIGAGLLLFALDYFVENNLLIDYIFELYRVNGNAFNIFERQKALLKPSLSSSDKTTATTTTTRLLALTTKTTTSSFSLANATSINSRAANSSEPATNSALALFLHLYSSAHARLCWYTWLIFGIYFVFLISSILVQYCITGKNYDHRDSWQKLIRGSRKKRSANLEKIRLKSHVSHESADHHHHHHHGGSGHHHHHHSRHHHHHHRHHSKSTPPPQSSSNTATSSGTNTDRLSLSAQSIDSQNNDTLLLVTNELHPPREYQGKSGASRHAKQSSAKVVKQHHVKSSKAVKNTAADLQIVSFEVIKSPKSKDKERHREKTTTSTAIVTTKTENSNKTAAALPSTKPSSSSSKQSSSISTTTSSSSSASSTCQLIPVHLVLDPSAPPAPSSSSSSSSENQQQQPPPVPSQPPPKLPPMFAAAAAVATSTATITSNGATVSSLQASMAKMKQHRSGNSGSAKKSDSSGDKFRHFYQIRRNNGDVLSQDFLNNFHSTKIHSTSNLNTNESATDSASNAPLTSSLNSSDNSKKKRRSLSSKSKS